MEGGTAPLTAARRAAAVAAILGLAVALGPTVARAQAAAPTAVDTARSRDASPGPIDNLTADTLTADTLTADSLNPDSLTADSPAAVAAKVTPRAALWRSALAPGWGQWSVGHPWKAVLFAGAAGGWLGAAVIEGKHSADADDAYLRQEYAARRNTRVLWYLITATLAGLDAYVDAHLADFDIDAGTPDLPGARLRLRF